MQVERLEVKNYRSIKSAEIYFENKTALLGENNCGKSTVFKALELFFSTAPKIEEHDFHLRDTGQNIEITVHFKNLVPEEVKEFGTALVDGSLIIKRTMSFGVKNDGTFQTYKHTNPEFVGIREEANGTKKRVAYNKIRDEYKLPSVNSHTEVEEHLLDWERENKQDLGLEFARGFFGADNVAAGKLRQKTALVFVPATLDVDSQIQNDKQSPIIKLLSEISRLTIENKKEVTEFLEKARTEYGELTNPDNIPELSNISEKLTKNLQELYRDSKLHTKWSNIGDIQPSYPRPSLTVEDGGVFSSIENVGHGLQRAALLSVVRFLAENASVEDMPEEFETAQSDILFLIEEPEIYQHPQKQIVFRDALDRLAGRLNKSNGIRIQVAYTTHSEKQISIRDFGSIRILRKTKADSGEMEHLISSISIQDCIEYFSDYLNVEPMSEDGFLAKMHIFSKEMCEGFFAKKVILVEGVSDKGLLEGYMKLCDRNADEEGISILSADGKTKMDKPFFIFKRLGIPTYVIFDSDVNEDKEKDKKPNANKCLQYISGVAKEKLEDYPDGVYDEYSAFEYNLNAYLIDVAGEKLFDNAFTEIGERYGLKQEDISKTPDAIKECLEIIVKEKEVTFIKEVMEKVDAL